LAAWLTNLWSKLKTMFGLQVFNAAGVKTLDVDSRACLVLGTIEISPVGSPNAIGSLYLPELDGTHGTPFAFIGNFTGYYWSGDGGFPYCGITDSTLVWENTTGYAITLTYGVF
jgi:hypothetical protein